ncbi:unnamed protein product [Gordionus sp. m RMFG-2023]
MKVKFNKYYALTLKSGWGTPMQMSRYNKFVQDYYWLKENVKDIDKYVESNLNLKPPKMDSSEENLELSPPIDKFMEDSSHLNSLKESNSQLESCDSYLNSIVYPKINDLGNGNPKNKKLKNLEAERIKIFQDILNKKEEAPKDVHHIMGFFASFLNELNDKTKEEIYNFKIKFLEIISPYI